jgi:ribosomal protein L44E
MKIINKITKFCKKCKSHQKMTLEKDKKRLVSPLTWICRQKARYTGTTNKGKYSKPPKAVTKASKKGNFRLICNICKTIRVYITPRTKKIEIVKVKGV